MNSINVSCDTIKDLIPLYHDKVCSENSEKLVEEHIKICDECNEYLKSIDELFVSEVTTENMGEEKKAMESISKVVSKEKRKSMMKGIAIVCIAIMLYFVEETATKTSPFVVPTSSFTVSDVQMLSNGNVVYKFSITDGKSYSPYWENGFSIDDFNNKRLYEEDFERVYRLIPRRALINGKYKPAFDNPVEDGEYMVIDSGYYKDMMEYYVGDEDDHIVVWRRGDDIPMASKEFEDSLEYKGIEE